MTASRKEKKMVMLSNVSYAANRVVLHPRTDRADPNKLSRGSPGKLGRDRLKDIPCPGSPVHTAAGRASDAL